MCARARVWARAHVHGGGGGSFSFLVCKITVVTVPCLSLGFREADRKASTHVNMVY